MPRKRRNLQDREDAELAKEVAFEGMKRRDELVLELLKTEGFCLGCLPLFGPPPEFPLDFTVFIARLDGSPNLVVATLNWTLEKVSEMFEQHPSRQLAHGTAIEFVDGFEPAVDDWFPQVTPIIYVAGHVFEPHDGVADHRRWAHCATIRVQGAGTESRLRVIHIGLGPGRDSVFVNFLAPHGLVPRRLLL
jgi:hypothetical protein